MIIIAVVTGGDAYRTEVRVRAVFAACDGVFSSSLCSSSGLTLVADFRDSFRSLLREDFKASLFLGFFIGSKRFLHPTMLR